MTLDSVREEMAELLRQRGVDALCAWPEGGRVRKNGAVAAVSLRQCEGGPAGFRDYLGERYNQESGQWEELYGRKVRLVFGLDLYAPKGDQVQSALDRLTEALCQGGQLEHAQVFACGNFFKGTGFKGGRGHHFKVT